MFNRLNKSVFLQGETWLFDGPTHDTNIHIDESQELTLSGTGALILNKNRKQ